LTHHAHHNLAYTIIAIIESVFPYEIAGRIDKEMQ
jgi:hypothetical protein